MMHRRTVLVGSLAAWVTAKASAQDLVDDKVRSLLIERVGAGEQNAGLVAVISDGVGSRVIAHGHTGMAENQALDGDTVFEIGSITKVLTALMLADMDGRGELALTDPLARHLPPSVKVPERGKPITLLDLATYTSGLPNWPLGFKFTSANPLADYTASKVYASLMDYELPYEPGTHYAYANLGFGLLGLALAHRTGKSFETLLKELVCVPLGLTNTSIALSEVMRAHIAQGHDQQGRPAPLWDMPGLEGAGAVRSTAKDLSILLEASMGIRETPLRSAFAKLLATKRSTGLPGTQVGLGWFITSNHGGEIVWKSGLTGGYRTNLAYSTVNRRGAVILSNAFNYDSVGISTGIINPDFRMDGVGRLL
jgi:D-alanyl-D-alanine-carboxypeptidase/D-alanyl-D-alanine-endopeptidase